MCDCELKGAGCEGKGTDTYQCVYCCIDGKEKVSVCKKCFLELYKKKNLICQKAGCVEHTDEIKKEREALKKAQKEQAERERAEEALKKLKAAKEKLKPEVLEKLDAVEREFPNCPSVVLACGDAEKMAGNVQALVNAAKAAKWAAANIPGVNVNQMLEVFYFAFSRNSSVTLGGSRVRAYHVQQGTDYREGEVPFTEASDLDVGYSRLTKGQASSCWEENDVSSGKGKDEPWLALERAVIVPGAVIGGKAIDHPDEFFQRSGKRADNDLKSKTQSHYYPSGSVTFDCQNGDANPHPPA